MTRQEVSQYLLAVLAWPGITGDRDLLVNAVERWHDAPGLAFVDAYLAALASTERGPVFTKNVAEL